MMNTYGQIAIRATESFARGDFRSPNEAWDSAAQFFFPDSPDSREKGCPKGAYLGLCEIGAIIGIPRGSYTQSRANKEYALSGLELLIDDPMLSESNPSRIWRMVMSGSTKKHNSQLNVLLALWNSGMIGASEDVKVELRKCVLVTKVI